ncbi:MAG: hypothetical protein ACO1OQ_00670, partial [Rufibacter sp.]
EWPLMKGILLSDLDVRMRRHILDIACQGKTSWANSPVAPLIQDKVLPKLKELAADGVLVLREDELELTAIGHQFLRSVCAAFDLYLGENQEPLAKPMFSKAV